MSGEEFNAAMHEKMKQHFQQKLYGEKKQEKNPDPAPDPVNHPHHYEYAGFQVIDILKAVLPADWFKGFLLGNVIKYVLRAFRKNGFEDFKKSRWYLDRLIQELDAETAE